VEGVENGLQLLQSLVEEHRSPPAMLPVVTMYQGWVHTYTGQMEKGIAELRESLADYSQGTLSMVVHYKGYLADALARAGRVDEGLAVLEEALEQVERTNERFSEAELFRLRGELLAGKTRRGGDAETRREGEEEVEACFRRAIEVAQRQEAKSWELRATTSLARLLRDQGRYAEAREMLSAVYGWFTEGFDTPDLREARALLEMLQSSAPHT
jgi:predicted ATPase